VSPDPVDYYDVLRPDGERAFDGNFRLLGSSIELAPGTYVAVVNQTRQEVVLRAGEKSVLQTGEILRRFSGARGPFSPARSRCSSTPASASRTGTSATPRSRPAR
jgi:hypothetical protein